MNLYETFQMEKISFLAPYKMATVTKTKTLMINGPKQLYLKPESAKIVT
jgi:hypothetical protein